MKTAVQPRRTRRAGFTLMELSTAMGLMLILGSSLVVMLQQHVTLMSLAQRQSFLADEAPKIGNLIGRMGPRFVEGAAALCAAIERAR